MVTPVQRREAVLTLVDRGLSKTAAARFLGLSRAVVSHVLRQPAKDAELAGQVVELSQRYPRFGYRRISAWTGLGQSRIRRLWSCLGLALPRRRPRRRRSGSDIRLPNAVRPNVVWSYDFVHDRTANGRMLKLLCVLDECTRECLAIEVGRSIRSQDVILTLSRLIRLYGKPAYIRSDNGAEFTSAAVMRWLRDRNVGPTYIRPGSPWENGALQSFNGKLRDECLNREWFVGLRDAKVAIEQWRALYNRQRPRRPSPGRAFGSSTLR